MEKISERKLTHEKTLNSGSGAVEHLRLHGIAHRDLKAEKVMLLHASRSEGFHCKLIDRGLAVRCLGFKR